MSWLLAFFLSDLFLVSHSCSQPGRGFNPWRLLSQPCFWPMGDASRRWECAAVCLPRSSSFPKVGPLWFQLLLRFWPLGACNSSLSFCPLLISGWPHCSPLISQLFWDLNIQSPVLTSPSCKYLEWFLFP